MSRFIWMLVVTSLCAAADARAQTNAATVSAQQLSLVADMLKPAVVGINAGEVGKGLIVGVRPGEWLIATAAHVVYRVDDNGPVDVTVFIDDGEFVHAQGRLLARIDAPVDLAFVAIPGPPGVSSPAYATIERLPLITPVVTLGGGNEWRMPLMASNLTSLGVADTLRMEGAPVEPGYSGGPAIGPGGVAGIIVRQLGSDKADIIAISAVRREFDAQFGASWHWLPRVGPKPVATGAIRLTRGDDLGGYLALKPVAGEPLSARSGQLLVVPAESYVVKALTPGGVELDCDPASVSVIAGGSFESGVNCRFSLDGKWHLLDATLDLEPLGLNQFSARLSGNPLLDGHGSARFDGTFAVLTIRLASGGSWSSRLRVSPDAMTGQIDDASWYLGPAPFKLNFLRRSP